MSQLKTVEETTKFIFDFRDFVKIYQQVTLMDMEKIRARVLKARAFKDGLQDVFVDVKQTHKRQIEQLLEKNPKQHISFSTLEKNGKGAAVLLTPKTKFSGAINKKVFDEFAKFIKNKKVDVFILGKTGQNLFSQHFPNKKFEAIEEVNTIVGKLLDYQTIDVFYPLFHNVVTQTPISVNLSGEKSFLQEIGESESETDEKRRFLFEPDLIKILNFFEVQVFGLLFRKSIEESNLAHLGARLTTLEATNQTLTKQTTKMKNILMKLKRQESDKKQRERLAGIQLWQ